MNQNVYAMAERDAKYISDVEDSWKRDHDQAMKVLDLEGLFCFISNAVDKMFEVDNLIHGNGSASEISDWNGHFEVFLRQARGGMEFVKGNGKTLGADTYENAECTPAAMGEVIEKIDGGLTSIKEWREWTPPEKP
jgi:hypothetical protein